MAKKFKRNIAVTVYRMQPDAFFAEPSNTNAIVFRDQHMRVKIEKSLTEQPNTAEIEIFNLAERSRSEFKIKPALVRVEAGYGTELARLFDGDITFADSAHMGVDWVTKVSVAEGGRAYANATVNRSYKAGATYATAIGETAKSMGLKMPGNVKDAKELGRQFVSGVSLTGPSRDQMSKLLKPHGMSWSVQNRQLQILKENGVRPDEAIVISSKTGMIGSPIVGAPKEPGDPISIKVKTLLEPALLPGGRIKVISEGITGLFKIDKVTITVSNFEQDYYSDVDGSML